MAFATVDQLSDNPDLLYKLFEQHVKDQLKEQMLPIAMKMLDASIDDAVKSMETNIRTMYDFHNDTRLIKIILEKK